MNPSKTVLAVLALFAPAIPARAQICGPDVKLSTRTVKEARDPASLSTLEVNPPADKAIVYVLRNSWGVTTWGFKQTRSPLSIDREWVGSGEANSYFVVAVEPGPHDFCSQTTNGSHLTLTLEAGKTYFLEQRIHVGLVGEQNELVQLDDREGRKSLAKRHRRIELQD
jgi:Protein of unknown function (DUF2846)